jgi:hypothetical protein
MRKRLHEKCVETARGQEDCAVCLDPIPRATHTQASLGLLSFQCAHALCRTCDREMHRVGDNRCPTCRAPRRGMSATEAEPPSYRNAIDEGEGEAFLRWSLEQSGFEPVFTRGRDGRLIRPDTGYTIFFPAQPPIFLGTESVPNVLEGAMVDGRTRVALESLSNILPPGLVDALLDPTSVSISEWNAIRSRRRPPGPVRLLHALTRRGNENNGRRGVQRPGVRGRPSQG